MDRARLPRATEMDAGGRYDTASHWTASAAGALPGARRQIVALEGVAGNRAVTELLASTRKGPRDPDVHRPVVQRQEDDEYGSEWSAGPGAASPESTAEDSTDASTPAPVSDMSERSDAGEEEKER